LFGENGAPEVNYEIDDFHDELGIAVEVEAGRGRQRRLPRYRRHVTDLGTPATWLCCPAGTALQPVSASTPCAYEKTRTQLSAIYASQCLRLPFEGVLLIGY
jgi:hypothetical protein